MTDFSLLLKPARFFFFNWNGRSFARREDRFMTIRRISPSSKNNSSLFFDIDLDLSVYVFFSYPLSLKCLLYRVYFFISTRLRKVIGFLSQLRHIFLVSCVNIYVRVNCQFFRKTDRKWIFKKRKNFQSGKSRSDERRVKN